MSNWIYNNAAWHKANAEETIRKFNESKELETKKNKSK